jgi:hypothetical protein
MRFDRALLEPGERRELLHYCMPIDMKRTASPLKGERGRASSQAQFRYHCTVPLLGFCGFNFMTLRHQCCYTNLHKQFI